MQIIWRTNLLLLLVPIFVLFCPAFALAEIRDERGIFGGLDVSYRVILPHDFDPARAYPTVLHFAGGSQDYNIVTRSTEADWRQGAEERGYIVISPAAPGGQLFFRSGDRIFPEFIEYIFANYPVAGEKLHVTGHSNGGLSAFHVARLYPQYFISLTGYPGLLNAVSAEDMAPLAELCIYMHVGDQDPGWRGAMEREALLMRNLGFNVSFTVEPDQIHRLDTSRDNLGERLFAGLERARAGCL